MKKRATKNAKNDKRYTVEVDFAMICKSLWKMSHRFKKNVLSDVCFHTFF